MSRFEARPAILSLTLLLFAALPTSATDDPVETFKLVPDSDLNRFGYSVAISGTLAIGGRLNSQEVEVYEVTTGQSLGSLTASDSGSFDNFGRSISLSDQIAIVGAASDSDHGSSSGSAYLFDVTTSQQLFKLTASDASFLDRFGTDVAISGHSALVGAPFNDDHGNASGSAYLFDVTTGQELFKLTASDAAPTDRFGASVDICEGLAIVGAPGNGSTPGAAYLFDVTTHQQLFKLTAPDTVPGNEFAASVAICGSYAIVGAGLDDANGTNSGSAYVFDVTTGLQLFKLLASDGAEGDHFGTTVAIHGTTAVVGAERDSDDVASSGTAFLFDVRTGQQLFKLKATEPSIGASFGSAVGIDGAHLIIGAPGEIQPDLDRGSAYLFDLDGVDPVIDAITPNRGPKTGGNTVAILGNNFTLDTVVTFGGQPGGVTFVSEQELQVVVPAWPLPPASTGNPIRLSQDVNVSAITPFGVQGVTNGYTYLFKR